MVAWRSAAGKSKAKQVLRPRELLAALVLLAGAADLLWMSGPQPFPVISDSGGELAVADSSVAATATGLLIISLLLGLATVDKKLEGVDVSAARRVLPYYDYVWKPRIRASTSPVVHVPLGVLAGLTFAVYASHYTEIAGHERGIEQVARVETFPSALVETRSPIAGQTPMDIQPDPADPDGSPTYFYSFRLIERTASAFLFYSPATTPNQEFANFFALQDSDDLVVYVSQLDLDQEPSPADEVASDQSTATSEGEAAGPEPDPSESDLCVITSIAENRIGGQGCEQFEVLNSSLTTATYMFTQDQTIPADTAISRCIRPPNAAGDAVLEIRGDAQLSYIRLEQGTTDLTEQLRVGVSADYEEPTQTLGQREANDRVGAIYVTPPDSNSSGIIVSCSRDTDEVTVGDDEFVLCWRTCEKAQILVPHVFNLEAVDAEVYLGWAGFQATVSTTCTSSVEPGRVQRVTLATRQIATASEDPQVVAGAGTSGARVPAGSELVIDVAEDCS